MMNRQKYKKNYEAELARILSFENKLTDRIFEIFENYDNNDVFTRIILSNLNSNRTTKPMPWHEWNNSNGISASDLATFFHQHKIYSTTIRMFKSNYNTDNKPAKGYKYESVKRLLPPSEEEMKALITNQSLSTSLPKLSEIGFAWNNIDDYLKKSLIDLIYSISDMSNQHSVLLHLYEDINRIRVRSEHESILIANQDK